jgi:hypothetical protein
LDYIEDSFVPLRVEVEIETTMPRPRASQHNLRVALAFSKTVVIMGKRPLSSRGGHIIHVPCRGSQGVFAAFAACFPELTRAHGTSLQNNKGVAEIELKKIMQVKI